MNNETVGWIILLHLAIILVIAGIVDNTVVATYYSFQNTSYPSNATELYNFSKQVSIGSGGQLQCLKFGGNHVKLFEHKDLNVPVGNDNCYLKEYVYFGEPTIPEFVSATKLILKQFYDLILRLRKLYNSRHTLSKKYGREHVEQIDEDIARLSSLGMNLAVVSRQFLDQVKSIEAQKEVLAARKNALSGLKTFTVEIDKVNQMVNSPDKDKSFEAVTAQIEKAVRELEKEIQK